MEGREDAECECQAAFAEARRWVEVRRPSVLMGVTPPPTPPSPAVPSPRGGRPPRRGCPLAAVPPAPVRGLASPPNPHGGGGRTLPGGCPRRRAPGELRGRGSQTSVLCQQPWAAAFGRHGESLRRAGCLCGVAKAPPSPKSKLRAGAAALPVAKAYNFLTSCKLFLQRLLGDSLN